MNIIDQLKSHLNSMEAHYKTLHETTKLFPTDRAEWDMLRSIRDKIVALEALPINNIKRILDPEQEQLLFDYTKFLEEHGYVDSDTWAEEPTAIETFKSTLAKKSS
jgi:hypothetical protein